MIEEEYDPEEKDSGEEEEYEESDAEEEDSGEEVEPDKLKEEDDGMFSDLDDLEREIEEDMEEGDAEAEEESSSEYEGEETEGEPIEGEESEFADEGQAVEDGAGEDLEPTEDGISEADIPLSDEMVASQEVDEHSRQKNIVEGALFVAGRALSLDELNSKTEIPKRKLESILQELAMDYLERITALEIMEIQEKWVLQIKPEYTPKVKKFATTGLIPDRILKTLTIVALKQPILKSHLIKIRGSGAYEHVKYLLDRGYCEGIKKGRSVNLTTTDQFADTFGLSRDPETLKKQLIIQLGLNKQ